MNCLECTVLLHVIVENSTCIYGIYFAYQTDVCTDKFLNKFLSSENSICKLFENCTQDGLKKLYSLYGNYIGSVPDLCLLLTKKLFGCN